MVKCANKMRKQVKEEERKMKKSLCLMLVICMLCSTLQTVTVSFAGAAKAEASQSNTGALEAFKQNYDVQEIFEKVYLFYCDHETVNRLTINLYDSVKDLENGKIKAKCEKVVGINGYE
jgi:flagellar basal body-associated protein FliL